MNSGSWQVDISARLPLSRKPNPVKLWIGYGALSAGLEVTRLVTESLFLTRIGIRHLPTMFAIQALLRVVGSWAYLRRAEHLGAKSLLSWALSWMFVAVVLPSLWSGATGNWWPYALVYATIEAADTVIKVHWGVYLLELYRPGEAKTLFPLLYTASGVGRSAGGAFVRQTAATALLAWLPALSLTFLLPLAGLFLLGATAGGQRAQARRKRSPEAFDLDDGALDDLLRKPLPGASADETAPDDDRNLPATPEETAFEMVTPLSSVRKAFALMKGSRLVRAIALATILLVATRFVTRYVSLAILRGTLDTSSLARLLGTYSALAHVAGLGIQVLLTPRLTKQWGVRGINGLFSGLLWLATLVLTVKGSVVTALTARFAESEAKTAIKTPISPIFYYPVPDAMRPAARALILGVVSPASAVVTAILLDLIQTYWPLAWLAGLATLCATGFFIATLHQNREYGRTAKNQSP